MSSAPLPIELIHALLEESQPLDAWRFAQDSGVPLADWPAGSPRRAAGRLANALGDQRLSSALDYLNWRSDRTHPKWYFHALYHRHEWMEGWRLLKEIDAFLASGRTLANDERADLLAYAANYLGHLRDHTAADSRIAEALKLHPDDPWIRSVHASVLSSNDRYEDALEVALDALALRPAYHPSLLTVVDCLVNLNRDDEAIALLVQAAGSSQHSSIAFRLQAFFSEREDHKNALRWLTEGERRSPLAGKPMRRWLAARRADFLLMAGDIDGSLEACDQVGKGFHEKIAVSLRRQGARELPRRRLDVPFIRQHQMTCAPATLASIAAFWGKTHDHLAIADAICHEGTPWHKERTWAESHGFHTCEFRVTWDSLRMLIDRGLPFTLTTQATTSSHLQACIGYDARLEIALLRDPTERHFGAVIFQSLIEDHPIAGPRGMLMIPEEEKHRIEGIHLPEAIAYDAFHHLLVALDGQDRSKIDGALDCLRSVGGESLLVLEGEERAAIWKQDWLTQLRAIEAQLAAAPMPATVRLQKAVALRRLGRWKELREFLEVAANEPDADAVFNSELGELLTEDARQLPRAARYLRRAVRQRPFEARVHESLARCLSKQQLHEDAARLRRIVCCLVPAFEPYAAAYFETCRILRRQNEGIEFLEKRVERIGNRDGGPWITLAESLRQLNRDEAAAAVLERAITARPDDGDLLLGAASMLVGWGEPYRSRGLEWIEKARGKCSDAHWLRETARNAAFLGDRKQALASWENLRRLQPRSIDAWRGLARAAAEENGRPAAIAILDQGTDDDPEWIGLWSLKAEWLTGTSRGPLEALDRVLELNPADLWARRERAIRRGRAGDPEGALSDAEEAVHLDPWSAESHCVLASQLAKSNPARAADHYRKALHLDVDQEFAARRLIDLASDPATRLEALAFIEAEMDRQVSQGGIVGPYHELAWPLLDPDELREKLRVFSEQRPDLSETWSARIEHALRCDRSQEALEAARELTSRFPLLPLAWTELARVHRDAGKRQDEEQALARAVALSPNWSFAARRHAEVLEFLGEPDRAIEVLRRACELDPLCAPNHGDYADILCRKGHSKEALAHLRTALHLSPFFTYGWELACRLACTDGREEELAADLRAATEEHHHHPDWPSIAAEAWSTLGRRDEAINAIRAGLAHDPTDADLRDTLAYHLWAQDHYEEALAACDPVGDETKAPLNVRGRRAWILMHTDRPLEGVTEMNALVEEDPEYAWGLGELAEWHQERSDWDALRKLCEKWIRAAPGNSRALGYLGLARRNLKDNEGAIRAFARAHAADPTYMFVTRQLLDLQLEANRLDEAATTLATLRRYAKGPLVTSDSIELELKRGDDDQAFRFATELISDPAATFEHFNWVKRLFEKHLLVTRYRKWLAKEVANPPVTAPGALANWIGTLQPKNLGTTGYRRLRREPEGTPSREAGWEALLDYVSSTGHGDRLKKWTRRHRDELHQSGKLWGAVGSAFLTAKLNDYGIRWFNGWENRPEDLNVTFFIHYAALHDSRPGPDQNAWQEARAIRAEGLRRFPENSWQTQILRAGLALQLAADGEIEPARALIANLEEDRCSDYYSGIGRGARAIVAAADGDESAARSLLAEAFEKHANANILGARRFRDRMLAAVASHLAWTKGKTGKLRRAWGIKKGWPQWLNHPFFTPTRGAKIFLIIFIIVRLVLHLIELLK